MGGATKAGKGVDARANSIRITYTLDGRQERRTLRLNGQPMLPTPANLKYAERVAADIRERVRLGTFNLGDFFPDDAAPVLNRTVGQQLDLWFGTKRVEHTTKGGYSAAVRFWKDAAYLRDSEDKLGDLPLSKLKHSHLLYVVADRDDLSGKTIKNYLGPLKEAMALAHRDGVIDSDPAAGIKAPKWVKDDPDPFDSEEVEAIIAWMLERHPGQVHNMVEFWMFSGPRTGEIFGLKWPSVDFRKGQVRVQEALIRGRQKDSTKTGVSRDVALNSRSLEALRRQRALTQAAGKEVFQDPRYGEPWNDERAFRRSFWAPCLKSLGIRYRRPYNMRHTYATTMLMAGMNPAFCAKQLGHSVEMFLNTYSRWIDGERNALEMQRLEAALSPGYPQKQIKAS